MQRMHIHELKELWMIIMHNRKSSFKNTAKVMLDVLMYYCCPARLFNVTNLSLFHTGFLLSAIPCQPYQTYLKLEIKSVSNAIFFTHSTWHKIWCSFFQLSTPIHNVLQDIRGIIHPNWKVLTYFSNHITKLSSHISYLLYQLLKFSYLEN